jgi:DNA-binding transcriptional LysR family regulator
MTKPAIERSLRYAKDYVYYALYPHTRHVAPKVRAFVDYMSEHYRAH